MRLLKYLLLMVVGLTTAFAKDPKEKVIIVSWGDLVGDHTGDNRFEGAISVEQPENMKILASLWKEREFSLAFSSTRARGPIRVQSSACRGIPAAVW